MFKFVKKFFKKKEKINTIDLIYPLNELDKLRKYKEEKQKNIKEHVKDPSDDLRKAGL
tara:strand:- start:400 stop:573 length:174 start_codon:yes stop_codon:yes gene_type:complete